ncbi:hypothetical protein C8R45DRAFT_877011 [Mycena sanguinolenta]|nr:hypothetical protein C8R45DRAFT_877011 [Mycena sanguinolenta]
MLHASTPNITLTPNLIRSALLEQTERTRHCSKADIEWFIEESESRIISLQEEVDALFELHDSKRACILAPDAQLTALVELRDSQRACVLALRCIISPVRTLPVELLSEIFTLSIGDDTHIRDAHRISQVCAHWRQVAHSTPRLWDRPLTVDLCEGKAVADWLKAWLRRSFPLPIAISFTPVHGEITPTILEEVLEVAPRSSSLQFPIMYQMPLSFVLQLSQRRLDSLEELELGRIDETDHIPLAFTAPRLRKFSMAYPRPWQITVPWTQLTDLVLHSHSHKITFGILAQCTNLLRTSITTAAWHRVPEPIPDHDILVLGQLRTLILHCMEDSGAITPFFDYVSTPRLRILRLCVDREQPWTPASFTTFQLRISNMTRLEFAQSYSLTSNDVVTALIHASRLTHLKISYCAQCFDDVLIHTLYYYKDGVKPLLPRLYNLVVCHYKKTNFTETMLAGMIASRWWSDTELASYAAPPAVARWTHVEFDMGTHEWGSKFVDILKDIPSHVLVY